MFSNVTIFHILKNENYELCFLACFFIDEIMTGKNYDRKKKACQIWANTVMRLCWFFSCGSRQIQAASKTMCQKIMWSQFPPNLSCLQNNLLENVVEVLVGTRSTLFSGGLFWGRFLLDLIKKVFLALVLGTNWCTSISTTGPIYTESSNFYAKLNVSNLNVMKLY